MDIIITGAFAHNLKHINLSIPHNSVIGLIGRSGSGKSSLLKDVIASYGALNYARIKNKTIQDALIVNKFIDVDSIENLPQTILIDIINYVTNRMSTMSTVSGIHDTLRNMFTQYAKTYCKGCHEEIKKDTFEIINELCVNIIFDLVCDKKYDEKIKQLRLIGTIESEIFFDKNKCKTQNKRNRQFSTLTMTPLVTVTEGKVKEWKRIFNAGISVKIRGIDTTFDPLLFTCCLRCKKVFPRISKSRFSFNVPYGAGGGGCRKCCGDGEVYHMDIADVIGDKDKTVLDGGLIGINEKGIKHTTITEKCIIAFCNAHDIDQKIAVKYLDHKKIELFFYGSAEPLTFKDRTGGMKTIIFEGLQSYFIEIFKNKRSQALTSFIKIKPCPECKGTRIDQDIICFRIANTSMQDILQMSVRQLLSWCKENLGSYLPDVYQKKILKKLAIYEKVSCENLLLSRASSTLSGGELQRVRLCGMLNANLKNICYLIDEPSSGLHYADLMKLIVLFEEIQNKGNTIVIVDHNKKMLSACNYIVELGGTGLTGGYLSFSGDTTAFQARDSNTAQFQCRSYAEIVTTDPVHDSENLMHFSHITTHNITNLSVSIPRNRFSVVCGVSGSGKSSFIKEIHRIVSCNTQQYNFEKVLYMSQRGLRTTSTTEVADVLQISHSLAELFSAATGADAKLFLPASSAGKCPYCEGRGIFRNLPEQIEEPCPECHGLCYSTQTLAYQCLGMDIIQSRETSLSDLAKIFKDTELARAGNICAQLGIGYVNLSRKANTLSKGELQRVMLARILAKNELNTLCLLDEPTKGLHHQDILLLMQAIRQITANANTVIAVEHDPLAILQSDHVIEFGPGAGCEGGRIVYSGKPQGLHATPTARALQEIATPIIFRTHKDNDNQGLFISSGEKSIIFDEYEINKIYSVDDMNLTLLAAKKSEEIFLQNAAPMLIYPPKYDDIECEMHTPIMLTIDFSESYGKSSELLAMTLGLSEVIANEFATQDEKQRAFMRHVFSPESILGKCLRCQGRGTRNTLPQQLFVEGENLSRASVRFLANSTNFAEMQPLLKKYRVDLKKPLHMMSAEERAALFNGYAVRIQGKEWKGLSDSALMNRKYFPDQAIAKTFGSNAKSESCQFCNGQLLTGTYAQKQLRGLTYAEWMGLPLQKLFAHLHDEKTHAKLGGIMPILKNLLDFGVGDVCLSSRVGALSREIHGAVRLLSLFHNNIFGAAILIKGFATLTAQQRAFAEKIFETWKNKNTIICLG